MWPRCCWRWSMDELIGFERVHVVGAGGAGMSGLAKLLAQAGHVVSDRKSVVRERV